MDCPLDQGRSRNTCAFVPGTYLRMVRFCNADRGGIWMGTFPDFYDFYDLYEFFLYRRFIRWIYQQIFETENHFAFSCRQYTGRLFPVVKYILVTGIIYRIRRILRFRRRNRVQCRLKLHPGMVSGKNRIIIRYPFNGIRLWRFCSGFPVRKPDGGGRMAFCIPYSGNYTGSRNFAVFCYAETALTGGK